MKNKKKKSKSKPVEFHISFRSEEEIDLINSVKDKCEKGGIPLKTIIVGALYEIDNLKKGLFDFIIDVGNRNDKRRATKAKSLNI